MKKLAQYSAAKKYWRSLDELAGTPEVEEALHREFPEGAAEPPDGMSRRNFFSLMGASLAMAGLASCRRPEEKILPYSRTPEDLIPGNPEYFATAMAFMGTAFGLLVESHEGRPTKVEGNPRHPDSLGSTNAFLQASVLDLYDPDRSDGPREKGAQKSWDDASLALVTLGAAAKKQGGQGLAVLTEAHRSPTLAAALAALQKAMPSAKIFRYEPFSRDNAREGARLAFGRPFETLYDTGKAQLIVALDSDFLLTEGSPIKQARGFAAGRKGGEEMNRLYAVESAFTVTGAAADHRLRLRSVEVPEFTFMLARELAEKGVPLPAELRGALEGRGAGLPQAASTWAKAIAKDLVARRGKGLIVAGRRLPPAAHAVVHILNVGLGNYGQTVRHVLPFDEAPEGPQSIVALAKAIQDGSVKQLLILGGNPVFNGPADAKLAEAMAKLETSVHLASHLDETGAAATWHLNRSHYLESWGDVVAEDGTATVGQPLIAPLYDSRTDAQVVHLLLGEIKKDHALVRAAWSQVDELAWRRSLESGVLPGAPSAEVAVSVEASHGPDVAAAISALAKPAAGLEVTFAPDFHAWDGRAANNGWLQELPDAMTKLTWGNAALVSAKTAKARGLSDGDLVKLTLGGASITLPALIAPGQADDSIALTIGQGRKHVGRVGKEIGVDCGPLRTSAGFEVSALTRLDPAGGSAPLARTQEHWNMEDRHVVREATVEEARRDPAFVKKHQEPHPPLVSLYPDKPYEGHKWGMTIDLSSCIGCGGCMAACQAENNIPIVGVDQILRRRDMHWIRVDRYFEGDSAENPTTVTQPVPCQQCENAPCEQVCPVAATSHSPEGLNDMAYNRCIGTRYCENNCPFKVRRFNFFHYADKQPALHKLQRNPDVSIRSRGVMEKCTYCVQRINEAKISAHRDGKDAIADGTIKTACQQGCPTQAITFGDLNDKASAAAKNAADPRNYVLLEELNVRPRTSYLGKIRNPNPELAS